MKKILKITIIVVLLALMVATTAFAGTGKGNPKGEVVGIDEAGGTVTVLTTDGETLVVTLPADFDFTSIELGMMVVVKGEQTETGYDADWVKPADDEDLEDVEEPTETEELADAEAGGWGEGGVYCNGGKENDHPVAAKIAEKYGVTTEWVMSYVCDGQGFGSVMLALKTQELGGGSADEALGKRKDGQGWGQIWKEQGLVGNDKADSPPPGQLKKEDKQTGPPEDKAPNNNKDKDKDKSNNGKGN